MNAMKLHLNGDPLPWLLEEENPSIRYWSLRYLLERPEEDDDVVEAQHAISQLPLVLELFELQASEGHWGEEHKPYTATGSVGVLYHLFALGVEPGPRTALGCASLLRHAQNENGAISMVKSRPSGIFPCTTGDLLAMLVYFGMGDDALVRKAFSYVLKTMSASDALFCGRYAHRECLWGAISALHGLSVLPEDLRGRLSEATIHRLARALLDAQYDFEGEHRRWFTFKVPRGWDLISALRVLALHGFAQDPKFSALLEHALALQDEKGRWRCGSLTQNWPLEQRNKPSKWVTLDMLRTLNAAGYIFQ